MLASVRIAVQGLWPFLLLPLAIGLAFISYRRTTPPLSPARRWPLLVLRSLAYALLLVVLASPVWNRERRESERARVAVLVDESASMSSQDGPEAPSRHVLARGVVGSLRAEFGGDVEIEVVPFGATLGSPLAPEDYLAADRDATGSGTDIVGALRGTTDRLAATNLQALVLISDGRPTRGGLDAGPLAGLGRPVYTLGLGDTLAGRDLAIGRCEYPQVAYVESETQIAVRVENTGFRGQRSRLRLVQGAREIFRREIEFAEEHGRWEIDIPLRLDTPGRQRLRLSLEALPGEFTERNNTREISIEVLQNRIRVLALAARPDWDVAFMARTLRADPNVQLELVHLDAQGQWIDDSGKNFPLPQGARLVEDYDLFLVASPGTSAPSPLWKDIAAAVLRGKGLLVLAGRESALGSQAVYDALEPALPVGRGRGRAPQYGTWNVQLAAAGRHHPATTSLYDLADAGGRLAPLAPLLGRHVEITPKPAASVLLQLEGDPASPALVVMRPGQGQSAVWNGFPIWRWGMTEREPVRRAALDLVANLVRWLVQPRDVQQVQVTTSKSVYESGENVEFFAHVLDTQYAPLEDAELRLEVRRLDGEGGTAGTLVLERRAGRAGEYTAALPGLGPGDYEASVVAQRDGARIGEATCRFTVDAYSVEFANTSQDADFLREIAARTGGRYARAAEVSSLLDDLPRATRPIVLRSEVEIWNTTPFFVLFVIVLGVEWLLRKRYGLL